MPPAHASASFSCNDCVWSSSQGEKGNGGELAFKSLCKAGPQGSDGTWAHVPGHEPVARVPTLRPDRSAWVRTVSPSPSSAPLAAFAHRACFARRNYGLSLTREGLEQRFSRGHCSISAGYCHLSVHTPPRHKPPRLPFSSDTHGRCSRAPRSLPQRLRGPTRRSGGIRGLAPAPPLGPHNVQHF